MIRWSYRFLVVVMKSFLTVAGGWSPGSFWTDWRTPSDFYVESCGCGCSCDWSPIMRVKTPIQLKNWSRKRIFKLLFVSIFLTIFYRSCVRVISNFVGCVVGSTGFAADSIGVECWSSSPNLHKFFAPRGAFGATRSACLLWYEDMQFHKKTSPFSSFSPLFLLFLSFFLSFPLLLRFLGDFS